jgi:cysteine desulfurase
MNSPVYLDYAATTPVDPRVAQVMAQYLTGEGIFGNPSSASHAYGREAAQHLEAARADVAALIGAAPECMVFTSGATEADNLAILGVARGRAGFGRHLVSMRTEHKAVLDACRRLEKEGFELSWVAPAADGLVDPAAVAAALRPDTQLVSIMHANNELGVIQDIPAIAAACRERGVLLHTDAAQSAGRLPMDVAELGADLVSLSAHKLYGPKGVGALYVAARARPWVQPLLLGGGQERGLRPGTVPLHQVAGFAAAARLVRDEGSADAQRCAALAGRLSAQLASLPGLRFNGHPGRRLPGFLSVSVEGVEGESLLAGLGELALSSGSACDSALAEPSYVLRAIGLSSGLAQATLRISLGRFSTEADVDLAAAAIRREVVRLRAVAP